MIGKYVDACCPASQRRCGHDRGTQARDTVPLDSVERAIADVAAGRAVVVVDDANRENEGDIVFAASKAMRRADGVHDQVHPRG